MFNVKTIDETKKIIRENFDSIGISTLSISIDSAKGYIVSEDIVSTEEVPQFNRSTVDGYAVFAESVAMASQNSPIPLKLIGESEMGKACNLLIDQDSTVYVPTGGHVPENATGMVMIEDTEVLGDEILVDKGVSHYQNMLLKGSDVKVGDIVVNKGTKVTDTVIGLLKALGIKEVPVYRKLKIMIISTGDEITDNEVIELGQVRDINTYTIASYLENYNVEITSKLVIVDNFKKYLDTVKNGIIDNDIVIASGGSSVGEKDYSVKILDEIGFNVLIHGMSIKPGKPTIIAKKEDKLFFGLPGHPTSAYIVLNELFNTMYSSILKTKEPFKPYIEGYLTQKVYAKQGRKLYQIVEVTDDLKVIPLFAKSGMIQLLSKAYGYITLEDNQEGVMKGAKVKVYRFGD